MTRWSEDPSIPAPDGHHWARPAPEDCPNCPSHTARVCEQQRWAEAERPVYDDGTPYTEPCPCETAAQS